MKGKQIPPFFILLALIVFSAACNTKPQPKVSEADQKAVVEALENAALMAEKTSENYSDTLGGKRLGQSYLSMADELRRLAKQEPKDWYEIRDTVKKYSDEVYSVTKGRRPTITDGPKLMLGVELTKLQMQLDDITAEVTQP